MVKNLKGLRAEKGVSQKHLADVIGVSQQSINKYENHSIEPDIDTLGRLADFFDTSIDYLVGRTTIRHAIEEVQQYDLNGEESLLLKSYRMLSKGQKESLQSVVHQFLKL